MESTLQKPAFDETAFGKTAFGAGKTALKATTIAYWVVTALFCLQIGFTAYAQLRLPQVAEEFAQELQTT
jgi:hypothetical protein